MITPATAAEAAIARVSSVARNSGRLATRPRPTPSAISRTVVRTRQTGRALFHGQEGEGQDRGETGEEIRDEHPGGMGGGARAILVLGQFRAQIHRRLGRAGQRGGDRLHIGCRHAARCKRGGNRLRLLHRHVRYDRSILAGAPRIAHGFRIQIAARHHGDGRGRRARGAGDQHGSGVVRGHGDAEHQAEDGDRAILHAEDHVTNGSLQGGLQPRKTRHEPPRRRPPSPLARPGSPRRGSIEEAAHNGRGPMPPHASGAPALRKRRPAKEIDLSPLPPGTLFAVRRFRRGRFRPGGEWAWRVAGQRALHQVSRMGRRDFLLPGSGPIPARGCCSPHLGGLPACASGSGAEPSRIPSPSPRRLVPAGLTLRHGRPIASPPELPHSAHRIEPR